MRTINRNRVFVTLLAGLGLLAIANTVRAQQDYTIDTFDTDDSATWTRWWGSAQQTYVWDYYGDANHNPNSGGLEGVIQFDINQYGGDNQFALVHYFGETIDASQYTNLVFDLRFDKDSPTRPISQDYGYFEYGLVPSDYSQIELGGVTVPAGDTNWVHVSGPIDPTTPKIDGVIGVWFKIWAGDTSANADNQLTGMTMFWLDNILLHANTNTAPAAPPTLALKSTVPGLQLFASAPGAEYQRQSIYTVNNTGYSWVDNGKPVTYSLTITNYPSGAYSGFQTHIFLVPGSSLPTYETSPDWNEPNVIFLQIVNNADGTANATFRYKTNQANGNSMLFNDNSTNGPVGALASLDAPTPIGTWSMTLNNTNVTLSVPGGASTNFAMPAGAVALFADPMYAYFGAQPNSSNNIGQSITLSRVQISGVAAPIDDHFAGVPSDPADTNSPPVLDSATWQLAAQDPAGVVLVPSGSIYWLSWTLPDKGFTPQASPDLAPGSWTNPGLTNLLQIGTSRAVLIPASSVPVGAKSEFYRLINTQ